MSDVTVVELPGVRITLRGWDLDLVREYAESCDPQPIARVETRALIELIDDSHSKLMAEELQAVAEATIRRGSYFTHYTAYRPRFECFVVQRYEAEAEDGERYWLFGPASTLPEPEILWFHEEEDRAYIARQVLAAMTPPSLPKADG